VLEYVADGRKAAIRLFPEEGMGRVLVRYRAFKENDGVGIDTGQVFKKLRQCTRTVVLSIPVLKQPVTLYNTIFT
jgi:hypothetical protein